MAWCLLDPVVPTAFRAQAALLGVMAEGEAKGEAKALLRLLAARGLAPSQAQRNQVTSCTDAAQLDLWFDRAVTAGTAAEVFAD